MVIILRVSRSRLQRFIIYQVPGTRYILFFKEKIPTGFRVPDSYLAGYSSGLLFDSGTISRGAPFRLRDDIPRDSVIQGLNRFRTDEVPFWGQFTQIPICLPPKRDWRPKSTGMCVWDVVSGNGILHFSVARERDITICTGRVCAGTGFHIIISHGARRFLAGFDCMACIIIGHPTPLHTNYK